MACIIGVDFDNTIVSYDALMYRTAVHKGLIDNKVRKNKKRIRDAIRKTPNGEIEWQKLQAQVYGPIMHEAQLIDGVDTFFEHCNRQDISVHIVSHKTEYANYDTTDTNLRAAALKWMSAHDFFEADGIGLSYQKIYFESTRQAKINRIKKLRCTHFIDDLEETFLEVSFPEGVKKILYAPQSYKTSLKDAWRVTQWKDINDYFFSAKT
jgi:hypothetical protein